MSTVETYVIVPLMKWTQMEDAAMKKSVSSPAAATTAVPAEELASAASSEARPEPQEEEPEPPAPAASPTILPATKELVAKKKLVKTHFAKFLEAVKAYGGDVPELPNIDALIRGALGKGKRVLEHEEEFYQFLSAHGLVHLIKNPFKIKRYVPSWFRVA